MKLSQYNIPSNLHNEIRMAVAQEIVEELEAFGGSNASMRIRLGYIPRLQTRIDRANEWTEKNGGKDHDYGTDDRVYRRAAGHAG